MTIFDGLDNMFGTLDADCRQRLQAVMDKPTAKTWDDAFSIILSWKRNYTLWQAVIAVDPTFPRTGKLTDQKGKILTQWERIPDRELIQKAILLAAQGTTGVQ